jgi:hypothetical protein
LFINFLITFCVDELLFTETAMFLPKTNVTFNGFLDYMISYG